MINVWIANGSVNVRTRPFRDILYANHLLSISKAQWDTALTIYCSFNNIVAH